MKKPPVKLDFSEKYSREHAERYFKKHSTGLSRRLSTWREIQIARQALKLAGDPALVLDLPCGAGRFWPMLTEKPDRKIIGADNSADMLAVACQNQPPEVVARITPLQTSAFAIDLPDQAVDCIFSMRLLHHIDKSADRMLMLREFHRVTRDSLVVSLWVDGNYKARRECRPSRLRRHAAQGRTQDRFVIPVKTIEAEFRAADFTIVQHVDFIPLYAMWRIYILRKA